MIGHIESFDLGKQTGIIKSEDSFFEFHLDQWAPAAEPEQGDDVTFEVAEGVVTTVDLVGAYLKPDAVKSRVIAMILALFLGAIGAHRFYLGYVWVGIAQIALTSVLIGYGVMWGLIEFVLLLTKNFNVDGKGRPLK